MCIYTYLELLFRGLINFNFPKTTTLSKSTYFCLIKILLLK